MQDPTQGTNTPLYFFLGTLVTNIAALITLWLRDRSAVRREERRRQYELEDRARLVREVQEKTDKVIQPMAAQISQAAEDRARLTELLERNNRLTEETANNVKRQNQPRDKSARERATDKIPPAEGDQRRVTRRAADSHIVATSKLADATTQAAAATENLANTIEETAEEQAATAREIAMATAKVAIQAAEQTEKIADGTEKAVQRLDEIAGTVKKMEQKKND